MKLLILGRVSKETQTKAPTLTPDFGGQTKSIKCRQVTEAGKGPQQMCYPFSPPNTGTFEVIP